LTKKIGLGYILGDFFSKTHLVTLVRIDRRRQKHDLKIQFSSTGSHDKNGLKRAEDRLIITLLITGKNLIDGTFVPEARSLI
jgi:hypothetical protein